MRDRVAGLLLFLPVPLVLWLFTAAPLGAGPSLILGTVIMLSHRALARPFVVRHAPHRCLWCGTAASAPLDADVGDPLGRVDWRACSPRHRDLVRRTVARAESWSAGLRLGILGGLAVFLALAGATAAGFPTGASHADAAALFRLAVALTVLPFGLLAARGPAPDGTPRSPFPLHIQALIGTAAVLWLFRIVGVVWLIQVVRYAMSRGA